MSRKVEVAVKSKDEVADNVFAFTLEALGEIEGITKNAGAHIDVHLPSGLVRPYSLTGLKRDVQGQISIAVKRDAYGRGGSVELCDRVKVGDRLQITLPRNTFELDQSQDEYRLLAAGIGLTPILHMAIELQEKGKKFRLDVCAHDRDSLPFRAYLADAAFADCVSFHYSAPPDCSRLVLSDYVASVPENAQLYACGPEEFLSELEELTGDWPSGKLRLERFQNELADLSPEDDGDFIVELARSGNRFTVPPERTILEILNELGVSKDSSCLEGVCGTCITDVISGEIIHRDACLYEEEKASNSLIAVCVSRAKPGTTLVLDL